MSTASADLDEQVRVSADRAANPAAHTRATRAVLDRQRLGLCETRTVRWREMDSNFSYRSTKAADFRSIPGIAGGSSTGEGDLAKSR